MTLFKEILWKRLTVREAEAISRRIAYDKIRKKGVSLDPDMQEIEEALTETLGTRVSIERRENGGKVLIDFFSSEDLHNLLELIKSNQKKSPTESLDKHIEKNPEPPELQLPLHLDPRLGRDTSADLTADNFAYETAKPVDDRTPAEVKKDENDDLYDIKNFSV
jgi:hypothetical protein